MLDSLKDMFYDKGETMEVKLAWNSDTDRHAARNVLQP